jgi:hypothetical protein
LNPPGGSDLVAVLAIASTGLTVQPDPPRPAFADPATPHAGRDPDFAACGEAMLPIRDPHLQTINDLRWQGAQAP